MTSEVPRRDRPVRIRLTGPQYDLIREAQYIDSASDWDKVTLSEWIRRILIQESERIVEDYAENVLGGKERWPYRCIRESPPKG